MKILVVLDDSGNSEAVLEALLARTWPPESAIRFAFLFTNAPEVETADSYAMRVTAGMATRLPGCTVEHVLLEGNHSDPLLKDAAQWNADLIIVGPHGLQEPGRSHPGDFALAVLQHAHCSVLVVKPVPAGTTVTSDALHVLIAVDLTANSCIAMEWLLEQRWNQPVEFHLMTVIPPMSDKFANETNPEKALKMLPTIEQAREEALNGLLAWKPQLERQLGRGAIQCLVLEGHPKETILEEAAKWPAGLLFMGSHPVNDLVRFIFEGVSHSVAERALCSVEVVRVPPVRQELVYTGDPNDDGARRSDISPHVGFMG